MRSIGLIPSATGKPGGKETGQKVSHYIEEGGPFARACAELLAQAVAIPYFDRAYEDEVTRQKKAASKTKYTCPACHLNAWAKPGVRLRCGECEAVLVAAPAAASEA